MQPKLSSFFFKEVLPELSAPRISKYPGIRELGIWFVSRSSPNLENQPSTSTSHDKSRKRKSDQNLDSCLSNISPAPSNTVTLKRSRRKCSSLKFVGKRISHEWIEDDGTSKWYKGTVTAVIDKNDGDEDAEYEVHYENHKEANIVDHLNEDFKKGSLKFIDI